MSGWIRFWPWIAIGVFAAVLVCWMLSNAVRRRYYNAWFATATSGPWGISQFLAGLLALILPAIQKAIEVRYPDLAKMIGDLAWQVPLTVFLGLMAARAIYAPYALDQEQRQKNADLKAESENELAKLRAQDQGIQLKCSSITLSWGHEPELPEGAEGVFVALDVEHLVNGTPHDVVLDFKLVAPLWRSPGVTVSTSARPLLFTVSSLKSKRPQLEPLITLGKKQGKGPGYFLFFFSYERRKGAFFPPEIEGKTLEEFAALILESELQIEMVDRANNIYIPPVLAPGVLEKRARRLIQERKAQSGEPDESA